MQRAANHFAALNNRFNKFGVDGRSLHLLVLIGILFLSSVLAEGVPQTFLQSSFSHIHVISAWGTSLRIAEGDVVMFKTLLFAAFPKHAGATQLMVRVSVLIIAALFGLNFSQSPALAACSVTNTFTTGTVAYASQVNQNFTDLTSCVAPLASPTFTGAFAAAMSATNRTIFTNGPAPTNIGIAFNFVGDSSLAALAGFESASTDATDIRFYNSTSSALWVMGAGGSASSAGSGTFFMSGNGTTLFKFSLSGNATIAGCLNYNGGTSGTCLSDQRVKKDVAPFSAGLQEIVGLQPVTYKYNGLGDTSADGEARTGLIAQQVQKVAPQFVEVSHVKLKPSDANDTALLKVRYGDLTFALINAVKELKTANDNQAAEIRQLGSKVSALERNIRVRTAQK